MGDPVTTGIVISSLVSAGGQQVAASKQRSSQRRITAQRLEQERKLSRQQRAAELSAVEDERQSKRSQDRLVAAKGQQLQNQSLKQRGIEARPLVSFSDITRNVLDEGSGVG